MNVTLSRVAELCENQSAVIHPDILTAAEQVPADGESMYGYMCFTPTPLYAAVAAACTLLRRDPNAALYDGQAPVVPDTAVSQDLVADYFVEMLNASRQPVSPAGSRYALQCTGVRNVNTCSSAEISFAYTFAQMQQPGERLSSWPYMLGYQLLVDDGGAVVAVRKSLGQPSTFLLEDITINRQRCLAGSLLRAELPSDVFTEQRPNPVPHGQQAWIGLAGLCSAANVRLSGFTVDPKRRAIDFPAMADGQPDSIAKIFKTYTMAHLRAVAASALSRAEPLVIKPALVAPG